ncbi:MAG: hypothetical protein ABI776_03490 [Nocardioidaceae bacterium]
MVDAAAPGDRGITLREEALREDLSKEYYAILDVVSAFDGRIVTVKGWSVTLSLAALGLGFQQQHYALFGLAAATALGFWFIDVLFKGYQMRYYPRMRDIELAAYHLNQVVLPDLGAVTAPRIDMSWGYHAGRKQDVDWRTAVPARRNPEEIRSMMVRRFWSPNQLFPHMVAVVLGAGLFLGALQGAPGLGQLQL